MSASEDREAQWRFILSRFRDGGSNSASAALLACMNLADRELAEAEAGHLRVLAVVARQRDEALAELAVLRGEAGAHLSHFTLDESGELRQNVETMPPCNACWHPASWHNGEEAECGSCDWCAYRAPDGYWESHVGSAMSAEEEK